MKINKEELRRIIREEIGRQTAKKRTLSEGVMVPLKPLAGTFKSPQPEASKWMRIAGIVENQTLQEKKRL